MTTATKSLKGAATRDQILDAAARLIHLQGYHCTSLDDVLRESGVGKGNFYYYFKSKEDLGYAIIDRVTRGFIERTLEPVFGDPLGDPVAQIHMFLDRVLENQRQRNCVGGCPIMAATFLWGSVQMPWYGSREVIESAATMVPESRSTS